MTEHRPDIEPPFDARTGADDAFLLALSDACAEAGSPEAVLELTAAALGRRLGVDRVIFVSMDGPALAVTTRWTGDGPNDGLDRRPPEPDSGVHMALTRGETVVDHGQDPASSGQGASERSPIGAMITVPGNLAEARRKGLVVAQASPRHWTKAEIRLVERVGART